MSRYRDRRGYMRIGSSGPQVQEWQRTLADLNYDVGPQDGIYGFRTYRATESFQRSLNARADGEVGPQTLRHTARYMNYDNPYEVT